MKGLFVIEDYLEAPSLRQMLKMDGLMSTKQKKETFALFQDTLPIRFGGFMLLNQPRYISVMLALIRPFMAKKLRERIYLLGDDYAKLHAIIAPESLPPDFKGTLDCDPLRQYEAGIYANWRQHATSWQDLAIDVGHVEACCGHAEGTVREENFPPYDGSEKIKAKIAKRRVEAGAGDAAGGGGGGNGGTAAAASASGPEPEPEPEPALPVR